MAAGTKTAKTMPSTSAAAPVAVDEKALKAAYKKFNDRLILFIGDLERSYRKYPGLGLLKKQIEAFTRLDPARRMPAQRAWPLFAKHQKLIDARDEKVFTEHDLADLKNRAGLDTRVMWAESSAVNREAMWQAMEELLDNLLDINDIAPMPMTSTMESDDPEGSLLGGSDQKKSRSVATDPASKSTNEKNGKKKRREGKGNMPNDVVKLMKQMAVGDDGEDDKMFEEVIAKMNDPDASAPTEKDQEFLTSMLIKFVKRLAPGGDDPDDAELLALPEKEREAIRAQRIVEGIRKQNRLTHNVGKMMGNARLQQTTDPATLEADAAEAAAEKERMNNPEATREFSIAAHFNFKLCLLLSKLLKARGDVKSNRDGRLMFPAIRTSYADLITLFKENPATTVAIAPVGEWIALNRKRVRRRDDQLFLNPSHPFLLTLGASKLWATFTPKEREDFWDLIAHPIQLATIYHDLYTGDLQDIASIVDDLLASSGMSFDTDPSKVDGRKMIFDSIEKGCTPEKLKKIHGILGRMQNDPDQKTMRSITGLMRHVLPSALRARGVNIDLDEESDEDESGKDESDEDEDEKHSKSDEKDAKDSGAGRIQDRFAQLFKEADAAALTHRGAVPSEKSASQK